MDKYEKQIMVVPREILFKEKYFQGFLGADEFNFETVTLANLTYEKRKAAEEDPSLKQPIGYCLIVNNKYKKVFAYRRSSADEEYGEKRLQGKWSWGVGGHIEKHDISSANAIRTSMLRELAEEVKINGTVQESVLGYINDDQTAVGQVHFGILYLIETDAESIEVNDPEMAWGGFVDLERIKEILDSPDCEVESWSEIAAEPLAKILKM